MKMCDMSAAINSVLSILESRNIPRAQMGLDETTQHSTTTRTTEHIISPCGVELCSLGVIGKGLSVENRESMGCFNCYVTVLIL